MAAHYLDTVTDRSGNALAGATVQALNSSGALMTLYSDDGLTTPISPVSTQAVADDNGLAQFYIADGTYTIRQSYAGVTVDIPNVELYDLSTAAASAAAAATSAAASATSASAAAASASVAAALAGVSAIYNTYAAANSALSSIAADAYILVLADETHGNARALYQKSGGVLVFKGLIPVTTLGFVDSVSGSDSNDGLTPSTPKLTLAASYALVGAFGKLYLKRGSRFHESLNMGSTTYVGVRAYGTGARPIIDGSRLISAGAWTQDPTYANVEYADVTHGTATVCNGIDSNTFHAMLWEERDGDYDSIPLTAYWSGADIDANRSYVNSNAGAFTVHKQGSSVKDPRTDTSGTAYRYYRNKSVVSASAGALKVYYAEQVQIFTLSDGSSADSIQFQRTANKDMCGVGAYLPDHMRDCVYVDFAIHGHVAGAMEFDHCEAYTRTVSSVTFGGAAFHFFQPSGTIGTGKGGRATFCKARNAGIGYYCHGSGGIDEHTSILIEDSEAESCSKALNFGLTKRGVTVRRFKAPNCANFCDTASDMLIQRAVWSSQLTGSMNGIVAYGVTVNIEDMDFVGRSSAPADARLFVAGSGSPTFNLTRCAKYGAFVNNFNTSTVTISLTDSAMGDMATTSGTWAGLTATNSQLAIGNKTIAEIQAIYPNVNSNCTIPWASQPYSRVVESGDISYYNTTRTGNGASGANTITSVFVDNTTWQFGVGNPIRVVDHDGAGGNFDSHITAVSGTGAGQTITIANNLTATFSGKALHIGHFNKQVFPIDAGTVIFNDAGTQAYSATPHLWTANQYIYIGARNRRDAIGIRKITAVTASAPGVILTLDRAVTWKIATLSIGYSTFPTGTNATARPAWPVAFGFPMDGVATSTPSYTITKSVGSNISGSQQGSGFSSFSNAIPRYASTGAGLPSSNYDAIQLEDGVIDQAQRTMVGDTYAIASKVYIEPFDMLFEGNPEDRGQIILRRGSEAARLRLGPRI